MRLPHLFAIAAVFGMAMFAAQSPASAAQAGAAFAPAASKLSAAVSNDVVNVGRRCWWRYGRRVCRWYGPRRGYYGYRRGPSVGIYVAPRRGWRRGWRRGYW